jgi:hypothetical protein
MKNFIGALFWLTGSVALAQNTPSSTPASTPSSGPTSSPSSLPSSLQGAVDLFNAGEYSKAARLFESAQSAGVRDPIVWYYLGRCREATGETSQAIRAYQQYLKLSPSSPDAPALRLKLAELEANNPNANSQPTTQADDGSDPERPTEDTLLYSTQARIGYASTAIGGMTTLVGLMLRAVARDRAQFLEEAPVGTPFDEGLQEIEREGILFNKASIITLSVGGALLIGGITAALTAPKTQQDLQPTVRFWVSPSAASIGLSHSW